MNHKKNFLYLPKKGILLNFHSQLSIHQTIQEHRKYHAKVTEILFRVLSLYVLDSAYSLMMECR